MLSRSLTLCLVFPLAGVWCGCATDGTNPVSDAFSKTTRALNPYSNDNKNTKDTDDEWNEYGKQMRAEHPVETDNDPLRNLFVSPRAQDIERSLGVN